jgi:dTDP-4-dehydrorhamnose 3,5-epimerase-like enzyme
VWNDPDLGIEWPFPNPELSEKDRSLMSLKTFIQKHNSLKP